MSRNNIRLLRSYLRYRVGSKTKYKIHSPFVFDLITQVFESKVVPEVCNQIRSLYREQCRNSRVLETTDFGQSSSRMAYITEFLRISEIARTSSIKKKSGELLYRLVEHLKPETILELGTALGFSTLYIAKAYPDTHLYTIEGCAAKVEVARSNFGRMSATNIAVFTGRFDTQLPKVLDNINKLDFVFMDGHHQYRPTLEYFSMIMKHSHEDTVIVLDDIHWSTGMEKAWELIKQIPDVTVTIDLNHMGIVFFRKSLSKQNFIIRY
ncbi:MAG: class I SAM-dependent methyltransferase [Bacteroidetes bacterium]|nr:class I SAM-dependent methyltransferase [Bacteroidota bacterium]